MPTYYTGPAFTLALQGLSSLKALLIQMKGDMKSRRRFDSVTSSQADLAATYAATVLKEVPTVVSVSPDNEATGVSVSTSIAVTFSVRMDVNGLDFVAPGPIYLIPLDGAAVPTMAGSVTWSVNDTVATIAPTAPLEAGKIYQVIVGAGGGYPYSSSGAVMAAAYEQEDGFTTAA